MTEVCRLIIPVDVNEQNPNRRGKLRNWIRAKMEHKKAAYYVWVKAGKPKARSLVTVSVIVRRGHMLDEDNARASLKAVFDGLFKKAITPDDSPEWVRLGTLTQEINKRWKYAPEVEIIVRQGPPLGEGAI
jgi:hypothetical protein